MYIENIEFPICSLQRNNSATLEWISDHKHAPEGMFWGLFYFFFDWQEIPFLSKLNIQKKLQEIRLKM